MLGKGMGFDIGLGGMAACGCSLRMALTDGDARAEPCDPSTDIEAKLGITVSDCRITDGGGGDAARCECTEGTGDGGAEYMAAAAPPTPLSPPPPPPHACVRIKFWAGERLAVSWAAHAQQV